MNKQDQINEMAVIGCVRNPQAHTAEECAKCDFKQGQCNAYRHAEKLYNVGYLKVPNGAVVLTPEERDDEMKATNEILAERDDLIARVGNLGRENYELKEEIEGLKSEKEGWKMRYSDSGQKNKKLSIKNAQIKAENERLKTENANLLKACEEQFTFNTTENKKYSIFNSVRKEFADRVKVLIFQKGNPYDVPFEEFVKANVLCGYIDELLKEYE